MRLLAGVAAGLGRAHRAGGGRVALARGRWTGWPCPCGPWGRPSRAAASGASRRWSSTADPCIGIEWAPPVASAQVKSACSWPACRPRGRRWCARRWPPGPTPKSCWPRPGPTSRSRPRGRAGWSACGPRCSARSDVDVPGDPSQAAFWVVAACLVPGSEVTVAQVYVRGRADRLRRRAAPDGRRRGAWCGDGATADLVARPAGPLHGTEVAAAEIPSLDEVPVLAVAAAAAEGTTVFSRRGRAAGEGERPTGRGGRSWSGPSGPGPRSTATTWWSRGSAGPGACATPAPTAGGDHRMAMAAAVAALAAGSGEEVDGFSLGGHQLPGLPADLAGRVAAARRSAGADRVAIDGPAGSGKSTVSRAVAERLGLERLDTGAMYRAVAWAAWASAASTPRDARGGGRRWPAAARSRPTGPGSGSTGSTSPTPSAPPRSAAAVSAVAANPEVRRHLVERQRRWAAEHGGGVVEGRDIGTVVFPDADLKVFLTATPAERARRRHEEPAEGLARRDRIDSTRAASPLTRAERRPPARHHRAQRRGCGRGGARWL